MNDELRKSIHEIGSTVPNLSGGFWYIEAPQKTGYPYSVFSSITGIREKDSADKFDFIYLQINGYHEDLEVLELLQKEFESKFDGKKESFTMTNYWMIDIDLDFNRGPVKIDDEIFQFTQQYKIHIQHK